MKELSIEEKAKRYDEALKIINDYYQKIKYSSLSNASTDREVLEKAFPELKESEGERIRKELLEHCKNQAEPYIQSGNKCPQIQSWIAWLEKQGEQKPAWGEEDEYTLGETIQHLEELIRIDKAKHCGCDVQYYQRDIDWLKSLKDRVGYEVDCTTTKEWSEEDENRFNNLCWLIDKSDENELTKNGFKNWLKDRALPQPKQEWSEEDEKHRLNCLSYFNMIEKTSPYYEDYLWLKSLRNNNK